MEQGTKIDNLNLIVRFVTFSYQISERCELDNLD